MKRTSLWFAGVLVLAGVLVGWFGKSLAAAEPVLPGSEQDPLVSRSYVDGKLRIAVVEVPAGTKLIGSAGTEIIVRSGSATAIDTELGGLSDVTAGKDLRQGVEAPPNHLLIVPRNDGRGIQAVTSLFVLVRGNYRLQP
jgi:hypothetical protein